jgi:hypothetical protein
MKVYLHYGHPGFDATLFGERFLTSLKIIALNFTVMQLKTARSDPESDIIIILQTDQFYSMTFQMTSLTTLQKQLT